MHVFYIFVLCRVNRGTLYMRGVENKIAAMRIKDMWLRIRNKIDACLLFGFEFRHRTFIL